MTQVTSARLLPQKPSRWAKSLLNRKANHLFSTELTFLVFSYSVYKSIFHPLSYGNTCWVFLPSLFAESFHGFSFQIILADYHCSFPIFGTALLYSFTWLIWWDGWRNDWGCYSASNYLSTDPEVVDYLSHGDRQLQRLVYFLNIVQPSFYLQRHWGDLFSTWVTTCFQPCWGFEKGKGYIFMEYFYHWRRYHVGWDLAILRKKAKAAWTFVPCLMGWMMTTLSYDYIERLSTRLVLKLKPSPVKPIHYNYWDHQDYCDWWSLLILVV